MGYTHHHIGEIEVPVTYRKQSINQYKGGENYILRRYYVGAVIVALMYIYPEEHAAGKICVHITSKPSNGGVWFKRKHEATQMIIEELQRIPG